RAAVRLQALLATRVGAGLLGDVARSASLLRTGFYYVTGRRIDLPDQARYPADDVLHAGGVSRRDTELYDHAQVTLALAADRAELKQYYEGFAGGLAEQAGAFVDKR